MAEIWDYEEKPTCLRCGKEVGVTPNGYCESCNTIIQKEKERKAQERREALEKRKEEPKGFSLSPREKDLLRDDWNLVYNSNVKRLKTASAKGILKALEHIDKLMKDVLGQ